MQGKKKIIFVVIVLIMFFLQLSGRIRVTGDLLIPSAGDNKAYKGILTITRAEIRIECDKKIFQPFNEFDAPKQARLMVNTDEVIEIEINKKEKKILLRVDDSFVERFRNICHIVYRHLGFTFESGYVWREFWAIIFTFDNPLDMGYFDEEVIKSINNRARMVYTKYCFY